jgi:hypothetical protein
MGNIIIMNAFNDYIISKLKSKGLRSVVSIFK